MVVDLHLLLLLLLLLYSATVASAAVGARATAARVRDSQICSCSYEYGLIYSFKEISTAVPMAFRFRARRQACHVIANTEELPTIPIELSTKVPFFHGWVPWMFMTWRVASQNLKNIQNISWSPGNGSTPPTHLKSWWNWNVFWLRQRLILQHDGLKLVCNTFDQLSPQKKHGHEWVLRFEAAGIIRSCLKRNPLDRLGAPRVKRKDCQAASPRGDSKLQNMLTTKG